MEEYYRRHEQCIGIKGYTRGIVYDLGREQFHFVPNELIDLILWMNAKSQSEVDIQCNKNSNYKEYISYIKDNEWVFLCTQAELILFSPLDLKWKHPSLITNCIIELDEKPFLGAEKLNNLFLYCQTSFLEIRIKNAVSVNNLEFVLNQLKYSGIKGITVVLLDNKGTANYLEQIKTLQMQHKRILKTVVYSSRDPPTDTDQNIIYRPYDQFHTKKIKAQNFMVNIRLFTESQKHNTYFNRKLYLDSEGNIKNSPESENKFGNIRNLSNPEDLKQIITKPEFQQYWYVHKEQIDVCKDCEFRHMCVENRIPIQREDGFWYHREECDYNPYICKWKDEEGYQSLEDCGIIVSEKGYCRDDQELASINEGLWN